MARQCPLGRHCLWYKDSLKAVSQMSPEHWKPLPHQHPFLHAHDGEEDPASSLHALSQIWICLHGRSSQLFKEGNSRTVLLGQPKTVESGRCLGEEQLQSSESQVERKLDSFPWSKWCGHADRSHLDSAPTEEHRLLLKVLLQLLQLLPSAGWMFYFCLSHCVFC